MNTHELQSNLHDTTAIAEAISLMRTTALDLTDFDLDKEIALRKARCATQENYIKLQAKQFQIKRDLLALKLGAQKTGLHIDETRFGDFEESFADIESHESDTTRLRSVEKLTAFFRLQLITSIDEWSKLKLELHWMEIQRLMLSAEGTNEMSCNGAHQ